MFQQLRSSRLPVCLCLILGRHWLCSCLSAADWPQWRGPNRTGIVAAEPLFQAGTHVTQRWQRGVGTGFSSLVVVDGKLVTVGHEKEQDVVVCLQAETGEPVWEFSYPETLDPNLFEGGPTATPAIHQGRVFTISRQGEIHALDLQTGAKLWKFSVREQLGYNVPTWGFSGSPLAMEDRVIFNVGSHGLCLNTRDGSLLWTSSNEEEAGYASPVLVKRGERSLVLLMSTKSLNAVDPSNGELLWSERWITRYGINAADPLPIATGQLLVSSGYGKGLGLVEFTESASVVAWRRREVRTQMSPGVFWRDRVFAIDGDEGDRPRLVSFTAATGELIWEQPEFGAGSLIVVGSQVLILGEAGELTVLEAAADQFAPVFKAKVNSGRCWSPPVLLDRFLYTRNAAGTVVCSEITNP